MWQQRFAAVRPYWANYRLPSGPLFSFGIILNSRSGPNFQYQYEYHFGPNCILDQILVPVVLDGVHLHSVILIVGTHFAAIN
jgi:hypothetical protein